MKRGELKRRKPLATRRARIRALRPDEPIPNSEPKRYPNGQGYIRLRWNVAPYELVEEYEHRVAAGRPPSWMHVHHINGIKGDNRPENLQVLSPSEHTLLHDDERPKANDADQSKFKPAELGHDRQGRIIGWREVMNEDRRRTREKTRRARMQEARRLYETGLGTVEVGELIGLHPSGVSRLLRGAGVKMRSPRGQSVKGTGPHSEARQLVHARAQSCCERCAKSLTWEPSHIHHRRPRSMGGTSDPNINNVSNLLLLCVPCHEWAESHRDLARAQGYGVPMGTDPLAWPVEYHQSGFWLLDDEGGRRPSEVAS